jgi:transposase
MNIIKLIKNLFSKKDRNKENINKNNINIMNTDISKQNTNLNQKTQNYNNKDQFQLQENQQNLILKHEQDIKQINIHELKQNINTIWDVLKIKESTQAEHIIKSLPLDKWVTMDELKHNIKLEFNIEYKNEKSLYPYLKTLVDINLIKTNNTGKKRTWKKNIIIINNIK